MTTAISAMSVLCAGGFGAQQVWASARNRLSRIRISSVVNSNLEPIPMGLVPEDALDTDDSSLAPPELPPRARRMLRLAAPPLRALASAIGQSPVVLYLGLPEVTREASRWTEGFSQCLFQRVGLSLDEAASRNFPLGRASVLVALEHALSAISTDPSRPILIGGVDTFLDLRVLGTLGAEDRVHGSQVMDGFIPGEGASFLLLRQVSDGEPISHKAVVLAAASSTDTGHRYSTAPARGEGLAEGLQLLRSRLPAHIGPIASTFAGLNGENFDAKLWGVARLRHSDLFSPNMTLDHPADCFGDTGAATGAILTALAAAAVSSGHRQEPVLIWAASDFGERGCTLLGASASRSG